MANVPNKIIVTVLCPACDAPRYVSYPRNGHDERVNTNLDYILSSLRCEKCGKNRHQALFEYIIAFKTYTGYGQE